MALLISCFCSMSRAMTTLSSELSIHTVIIVSDKMSDSSLIQEPMHSQGKSVFYELNQTTRKAVPIKVDNSITMWVGQCTLRAMESGRDTGCSVKKAVLNLT